MAGIARRSGGSNQLSLQEHLERNTFRPDRHVAATIGTFRRKSL
jgi:hypothetical protein